MLANSALYLLIVGHSTIQKGFLTPAAEPKSGCWEKDTSK